MWKRILTTTWTKVLLAVLGIGVVLGGVVLWMAFGSNTASYEGNRGVRIPSGASFTTIVDSLESSGILKNRGTFVLMARATGWGSQLKSGNYAFESGASNWDLLQTIRKGLQTPIRLTIPPGTRPDVVARIIERDFDIPPDSLLAAMRDTAFVASLGTDTQHLFGYFLPETYQVFWTPDPEPVIRRLKTEFDRFFTDAMEAQAQQRGLTTDEVVTLASIVEWEARREDEKRRIAGVYLNRLRIGMALQADPTVQYALMQVDGGRMRRLTFADYNLDHPYNTYKYPGLPPGPITNPAPSTIRAVLDPESHDYLYFVADGSGGHRFSRTLREHNQAAQEYYRIMRERRREQAQSSGE